MLSCTLWLHAPASLNPSGLVLQFPASPWHNPLPPTPHPYSGKRGRVMGSHSPHQATWPGEGQQHLGGENRAWQICLAPGERWQGGTGIGSMQHSPVPPPSALGQGHRGPMEGRHSPHASLPPSSRDRSPPLPYPTHPEQGKRPVLGPSHAPVCQLPSVKSELCRSNMGLALNV